MNNKVLYAIIIFLLITIGLGTIFGLLNGHRPSDNFRDADPSPKEITSLNKHAADKVAAYNDLGQIRAVTLPDTEKDGNDAAGVAVVITPWLSYPEGDTVFFEELSRKRLVIKNIIKNYFSTHTQKELMTMTEPVIKDNLLNLINEQLTLNRISAVYFSEYIYLQ